MKGRNDEVQAPKVIDSGRARLGREEIAVVEQETEEDNLLTRNWWSVKMSQIDVLSI